MSEAHPELFGLVLAGGLSTRMGEDKALITYHQQTQLARSYELLNKYCDKTFVSVSASMSNENSRKDYPLIIDQYENGGPLIGIASALNAYPDKAWLVVACDLPFLDTHTIENLIHNRKPAAEATAYISAHDGLPEPLCAIWEPSIQQRVETAIQLKNACPRKVLIQADTNLLELPLSNALDNANTPQDKQRIQNLI